jgi:two-component system sensor histidine kinase KdpD
MNIQHLESLNDQVWNIAGIRVRETIPDWVAQQADEVVIIDLSPRALRHRLERGVIYGQDKIELALNRFFKESTLSALRELALRETAHEIENREIQSEPEHDSDGTEIPPNRHKILILATAEPETAMLIRRAKRVSDFLGAECFAATVQPSGDLSRMPEREREMVERHLNFARTMRIETRIIEGSNVAEALIDFAHRNQITQIFLARPRRQPWFHRQTDRLLQRIVRLGRDMQIIIVSGRDPIRR